MKKDRFRFDWLLANELAIGTAPKRDSNVKRLLDEGIKSILCLCSLEEVPFNENITNNFSVKRIVLPDHRAKRMPEPLELKNALDALSDLRKSGPVFVHCLAAMERSPLVCLGWLIREHSMSVEDALDYMMQAHPGTNPMPGQLALLRNPLISN